jgi:hypothetical protein
VIWLVLFVVVAVGLAVAAAWAMGRREEAELDRLGVRDD